MDFERKVDVEALLSEQDPDVTSLVVEGESAQTFQEEPAPGPTPAKEPERGKPDESALAAWMDDLREFETSHKGDTESVEIVDKLRSALFDDLAAGERERALGDITANDEQHGMVADFHADLALEGAGLAVPEPDDHYLKFAADAPNPYIDSDLGGGGGGGPPPRAAGPPAGGNDAPEPPPEDEAKPARAAKDKNPAKPPPRDKGDR